MNNFSDTYLYLSYLFKTFYYIFICIIVLHLDKIKKNTSEDSRDWIKIIIFSGCRILKNLKCAHVGSKNIYMHGTCTIVHEGWAAVKLNQEDIGVRPFIRLWEFGGTRRRERRGRDWGSAARSRTTLRALTCVTRHGDGVENGCEVQKEWISSRLRFHWTFWFLINITQ